MIIDFRLRPATRGFLNMHIFRNQERIASWSGKLGMVPPPSAKQGDMELMLKEMEEGGVTLGVVPGRQANAFMGNVPNEDIAAIVADYPEKFIGVAGIDPTNRAKALEEIERFVVNGPLKAVGMEPGVLASPMYADDRRIYPIYEYCAEHGIPVLLMGGGGNGPDLSHSNPIIIDRVCGDFPEMTVINTHGGYPWVTEILFVAFKRPNLYLCPDMYMYNMPGVSDYVMAANTFLSARPIRSSASAKAWSSSRLCPSSLKSCPTCCTATRSRRSSSISRAGNNPPAGRFQPLLRTSRRTHVPPYSRKSRRRKAFPPEGFAAPSRPAGAAFTEALCPPIHPKP